MPTGIDRRWAAVSGNNVYAIEHYSFTNNLTNNLYYNLSCGNRMQPPHSFLEIGAYRSLEETLCEANKHNNTSYDFDSHCVRFKMHKNKITFSGKTRIVHEIRYESQEDKYIISYMAKDLRYYKISKDNLYEAMIFIREKEGI